MQRTVRRGRILPLRVVLIAVTLAFVLSMFSGCADKTLESVSDALPAAEVEALRAVLASSGTSLEQVAAFDDAEKGPPAGTKLTVGFSDGHITRLTLEGVAIADPAPLAGLAKLTYLSLKGNGLKVAPPCAEDGVLDYLSLADNPIGSLEALAGCGSLRSLQLLDNGLADLASLPELPALRSLFSSGNPITTLAGLPAQPELGQFTLVGAAIPSLTSLVPQPKLRKLVVLESGLRSFHGLERFPALEELFLRDNEISDLSSLAGLAALKKLDLQGNPADIAAREWTKKQAAAAEADAAEPGCRSKFGCFEFLDPNLADFEIPPPPNPYVEKLPRHTGNLKKTRKRKVASSSFGLSATKVNLTADIKEVTGAPRLSLRAGAQGPAPFVRVKAEVGSGVLRIYMRYFTGAKGPVIYQYVEARPGQPAVIEGKLERYVLSAGRLGVWEVALEAPEGPARDVFLEVTPG